MHVTLDPSFCDFQHALHSRRTRGRESTCRVSRVVENACQPCSRKRSLRLLSKVVFSYPRIGQMHERISVRSRRRVCLEAEHSTASFGILGLVDAIFSIHLSAILLKTLGTAVVGLPWGHIMFVLYAWVMRRGRYMHTNENTRRGR